MTISNAIWAFSDTMMQGKLKVVGHLHRNVKEKHYFHMGGLKSPKIPYGLSTCCAILYGSAGIGKFAVED